MTWTEKAIQKFMCDRGVDVESVTFVDDDDEETIVELDTDDKLLMTPAFRDVGDREMKITARYLLDLIDPEQAQNVFDSLCVPTGDLVVDADDEGDDRDYYNDTELMKLLEEGDDEEPEQQNKESEPILRLTDTTGLKEYRQAMVRVNTISRLQAFYAEMCDRILPEKAHKKWNRVFWTRNQGRIFSMTKKWDMRIHPCFQQAPDEVLRCLIERHFRPSIQGNRSRRMRHLKSVVYSYAEEALSKWRKCQDEGKIWIGVLDGGI